MLWHSVVERSRIAFSMKICNPCNTKKATDAWHCQGRQNHNQTRNNYSKPNPHIQDTTYYFDSGCWGVEGGIPWAGEGEGVG